MKRLVVVLTILLFSGWTGAGAQSLAELAKKEKERREKLESKGAKSFNDMDLAVRGSLPISAPQQEAEPDEDLSLLDEEEAEQEDPTQTEAYWRNRLEPIDRRIADLQGQLNRPGFDQDPSNLIRRSRMERDLERARSERRAIVDEARRAGAPPGWLR